MALAPTTRVSGHSAIILARQKCGSLASRFCPEYYAVGTEHSAVDPMAAAKKKQLPKDFEALLAKGNLELTVGFCAVEHIVVGNTADLVFIYPARTLP